jgi:hypothetical protein
MKMSRWPKRQWSKIGREQYASPEQEGASRKNKKVELVNDLKELSTWEIKLKDN